MDSSQRTGSVTWRISASRASSPLVMISASTLVTSGTRNGRNVRCAQILFQALLRRQHQRAVKRRGNRQHHGALGAARRSLLHRALHRRGMAGNHRLLGRIQIRGRDHLAIRRLAADLRHLRGAQAQDRGHRAFARGHRLLHVLPAAPHQAHGIGKFQRARGHQRGIFAQAVPGDKVRPNALFLQDTR